MDIHNYGTFAVVQTSQLLYFVNAEGQDWYQMLRGEVEGIPQLVELAFNGDFISSIHPVWCVVNSDSIVTNVESDPSRLVPAESTVLGIDSAVLADVQVGMIYENGALAMPPPPPPIPYVISVSALWSRMTDPEAESFYNAMSTAAPFRLRMAFNSATSLTEGTELFVFTQGVMTGAIGETRTAEVMAPMPQSANSSGESAPLT